MNENQNEAPPSISMLLTLSYNTLLTVQYYSLYAYTKKLRSNTNVTCEKRNEILS